jgi:hypothetical protein
MEVDICETANEIIENIDHRPPRSDNTPITPSDMKEPRIASKIMSENVLKPSDNWYAVQELGAGSVDSGKGAASC